MSYFTFFSLFFFSILFLPLPLINTYLNNTDHINHTDQEANITMTDEPADSVISDVPARDTLFRTRLGQLLEAGDIPKDTSCQISELLRKMNDSIESPFSEEEALDIMRVLDNENRLMLLSDGTFTMI